MKEISVEGLLDSLIQRVRMRNCDSWEVTRGHEETLCSQAHEPTMLVGVLGGVSLFDDHDAWADMLTRVNSSADASGLTVLEVSMDGFGESRDAALRLTNALSNAWSEHDTCVEYGKIIKNQARSMRVITEEDWRRHGQPRGLDCEELAEEQEMSFTFYPPAILAAIESNMSDVVMPHGNCNPSWLLYTILAGHRKSPLNSKEVNYLSSLSLDGKAVGRRLKANGAMDAKFAARVLSEAAARMLMKW